MIQKVTWYEHRRGDDGRWITVPRPDQQGRKFDEQRHHSGHWIYSVYDEEAKTCLTLTIRVEPGCFPDGIDITLHTNFRGYGKRNACEGFECAEDFWTSGLEANDFLRRQRIGSLSSPSEAFWLNLRELYVAKSLEATLAHEEGRIVAWQTVAPHVALAPPPLRAHIEAPVQMPVPFEPEPATLSQPQGGGLPAPAPVPVVSPVPEVHRWLLTSPGGARTLVETEQFYIDAALSKYRAHVMKLCGDLGPAMIPDLRVSDVEYLKDVTVVR